MSIYRKADMNDVMAICEFTDWWLAGRGKKKGVEGAVDDCFISLGQHKKYLEKYETWICVKDYKILGWAVMGRDKTLIHLLVAADHRGLGIGKRMMSILEPKCVRSKVNQSTGNPVGFYEKMGFEKVNRVTSKGIMGYDKKHHGRKKNIDVLVRKNAGVRTYP